MSELPQAILSNRLYIPEDLVRDYHRDQYTYRIKNLRTEEIEEIETFKATKGWVGFSRGDMGKIQRVFGKDFQIDDQRAMVPHGLPLKFKATLRPDQQRVLTDWMKYGYGMATAKPRWGKTIWAIALMVILRQKTLVITHETDLLKQFDEELREHTNISELEKLYGFRMSGFVDKYSDVFPIVTLASWQKLNEEAADEAVRKNRDAFGLVIVDECQYSAAPQYFNLLSSFNPYWRLPVTATPKRKDGTHVVIFDALGPVTAEGETDSLPVKVRIVWTDHMVKDFSNWNTMQSRIAKDDKRNYLIASRVAAAFKAGRSQVVTSDKPAHGKVLRQIISGLIPGQRVDIIFGDNPDEKTLVRERAKNRITRVTVASNKIIQAGWNIKPWDTLHNTMILANEENWFQRVNRICTPCDICPGVDDSKCMSEGFCEKFFPEAHVYADKGHPAIHGSLSTMNRVHTKEPKKFTVIHERTTERLNSNDDPTVRAKKWGVKL